MDSDNARLRRRVDTLEATTQSLQATNQSLEDELRASKAAISLLKGQIARQQSAAIVQQTPPPVQDQWGRVGFINQTPGTPTTTTPVLKRKRTDLDLEPASDGGALELEFRSQLQDLSNPDVRAARGNHRNMWRFLLKFHYKVDDLIANLRLPPIAGSTKACQDEYRDGNDQYMQWDVVKALIKISQSYFPHSFKDFQGF